MVIKTKAVVLHVVKFGDNQLVVDFLTEALGRLSFMIRLPKSAKAKVKRQYFQPLSVLSLEFDYRPKASLQRLKSTLWARSLAALAVSCHVRRRASYSRFRLMMPIESIHLFMPRAFFQ